MTDKSKKAKSQCNRILHHLQTHKKGITPLEAWEKYGIYRLGARVWDLRAAGYDIVTEYDSYVNEDGHNVRYGRYVLR